MNKLFIGLAILSTQLFFSQEIVNLKVENGQKKEYPSEVKKENVKIYNERFFAFVKALKSSDRKTMDGLLSEKVREMVTDNVLAKVKDGIDLDKKLEVLKTRYWPLADGASYPMIEYRYEGSPLSAPGVVNVVFEEDGKILGIKPTK